MKSYHIKLKSVTPYLQHRMDDVQLAQWERLRGPIMERAEASQEDVTQAEFRCYRNTDGRCFIPSEHIRGALINAGSYVKAKVGGRSKSMKVIVAAAFMINPEQILIPDFDAIDKRSAVNKNVKARVMVIRPRWNSWEVDLTLQCREDTVTIETIRSIFDYAGTYVGIGSYRPTANGSFGQFEVISVDRITN